MLSKIPKGKAGPNLIEMDDLASSGWQCCGCREITSRYQSAVVHIAKPRKNAGAVVVVVVCDIIDKLSHAIISVNRNLQV